MRVFVCRRLGENRDGREGGVGSRLIRGKEERERKGEVGKRKRLKGGEGEGSVLLTRQSLVESSERNVKC